MFRKKQTVTNTKKPRKKALHLYKNHLTNTVAKSSERLTLKPLIHLVFQQKTLQKTEKSFGTHWQFYACKI